MNLTIITEEGDLFFLRNNNAMGHFTKESIF